jgi:branched-chain amino acid transport system permease protein
VILLPFVISPYHVHIVNLSLIAAIGALALNLLTGLSGQVSLGHAGFLAVGAFSVVIVERAGGGILLALPLAAASGGLIGLIVGVPATRFRGIYLAVCTLAMHYAIVFLAKWYQARLGSSASEGVSIPDPKIFGYELSDDRHWYGVLVVFVIVLVWMFFNVMRSRAGRAWIAIRERDVSAEALGVNLFRNKLAAFIVSSAIVSVSGALLSYYTNSVSADTYTIDIAVAYLAMIIIGGMGSPIGAILGAFFITFLPYVVEGAFSYAPVSWKMGGALFAYQLGAVGLFILFFLVLEPRGLIEIWRRIETYFERWPFRYKALQLARK